MPDATHQDPSNQYVYFNADFQAQQQLRKGMQVACVGMALLIGFGIHRISRRRLVRLRAVASRRPNPALRRDRTNHRSRNERRQLWSGRRAPALRSATDRSRAGSAARRREFLLTRADLRRLAARPDAGDRKTGLSARLSELTRLEAPKRSRRSIGRRLYVSNIKTILLAGDQGHSPAGGRACPDQISIRSPIVNLIARSECVG